jgi:hypothetical protein
MTTILEHGGGIEKYYIETAGHLSRLAGVQADAITMDDRFTNRILQLLSIFYGHKLDPKLSHKLSPASIQERLNQLATSKPKVLPSCADYLPGMTSSTAKMSCSKPFCGGL